MNPKLSPELYEWLKQCWRRDNHAKYQHLFEPWVECLTDSQIYYFGEQKRHIEEGSLTNWITR